MKNTDPIPQTETLRRKFSFHKFGPTVNPIGLQVALPWKGRELLGDVTECHYNDVRGVFVLTVRYFNGEYWPVQPVVSAVEIIG